MSPKIDWEKRPCKYFWNFILTCEYHDIMKFVALIRKTLIFTYIYIHILYHIYYVYIYIFIASLEVFTEPPKMGMTSPSARGPAGSLGTA